MIQKKQFKGLSLWGFKDQYEFPIKSEKQDVAGIISEFYLSRKSKPVENNSLSFSRGSKFWTWFNFWSELWPHQTIQIDLDNENIIITYKIHGGLWLRFPPYHLEKEIVELEKIINKI